MSLIRFPRNRYPPAPGKLSIEPELRGCYILSMLSRCAECGADTILHVNGVPLCLKCDYELRKEGIDPKKPTALAGDSKRKAASS